MRSTKLAVLFAVALAKPAVAQDRAVQFRVVPVPGNPSGCTSLDATLSGVHTIALMRDRAPLKSTGGINDTLKQSAPGAYRTIFSLGGTRLDVVADASRAPNTLTVSEAGRGCRWHAVAA